MIKTAIILAAGMGNRLGKMTRNQPKGFLEIDEKPIIEHSICKLIESGIDKIIIGTGYLHESYEKLAFTYRQIQCVNVGKYESTGSMYTLYQLKDSIHEDFLLLESDLMYEKNALHLLIQNRKTDVILSSGFTHAGDELYIEADHNHHLINMSKKKEALNRIYGEFIGITKISYCTFQEMCNYAETVLPINPQMDYENALTGIAKQMDIYVHKVDDLAWCEIDDENHLYRAIHEIYPLVQARERAYPPVKRKILLNPGPATTSDSIKYAQVVPDICPREREFGLIMEFIATELTKLVASPNEYTTILFCGSGTAAVESILGSVVGQDVVIIINNGAYGERMCQIAKVYGLNGIEFASPIDKAIDLSALEAFIQHCSHPISHLAIVHNETTTGLLNDIEAVGELCNKYQIQMIVDGMSSFAAIPIDMKKMNISYLAASSNKNLQGMAGVSFVIARKNHLENSRLVKPRNFYLHLYSQYHHFSTTCQMRFTPPVQTLYALKQAIIETKREGIAERYKRYKKSWETLIQGITQLGLSHLVEEKDHSKLITAIIEPDNKKYNFHEMHDFFYKKGITIYPGKLATFNTFRVSNIGDITYKDMEGFIHLLEQYLIHLQ